MSANASVTNLISAPACTTCEQRDRDETDLMRESLIVCLGQVECQEFGTPFELIVEEMRP